MRPRYSTYSHHDAKLRRLEYPDYVIPNSEIFAGLDLVNLWSYFGCNMDGPCSQELFKGTSIVEPENRGTPSNLPT
jgi:hypothetical protein